MADGAYHFLLDKFYAHIRRSGLRPGDVCPSQAELARALGTNRVALGHAIAALIAKGDLQRSRRKLLLNRTQPVQLPEIQIIGSHPMVIRDAADAVTLHGGLARVHPHNSPEAELKLISQQALAGNVCVLYPYSRQSVTALLRFPKALPRFVVCEHEEEGFHSVSSDEWSGTRIALEALHRSGHRQFACFSTSESSSVLTRRPYEYQLFCNSKNLPKSANRLFLLDYFRWASPSAAVLAYLKDLREKHPDVTAIYGDDDRLCHDLLVAAGDLGIAVPETLSLIGFFHQTICSNSLPRLTYVSRDFAAIGYSAGELALRIARFGLVEKEIDPLRVYVSPKLVLGESVLELGAGAKRPPNRRNEVELPFTLSNTTAKTDWLFLELSQWLNRSYSEAKTGWFRAEPLQHFPGNDVEYYGIPFRVPPPDLKRNAILFRSQRVPKTGRTTLPSSITIPIHENCLAVYFLQAAGWVQQHEKIGFCELLYADGNSIIREIISYGFHPGVTSSNQEWQETATVQDWWPNHPVLRNTHTRPVRIFDPENPNRFFSFLYLHEWVNPRPELRIKALQIVTKPNLSTTLAILGVTLLRPGCKGLQ